MADNCDVFRSKYDRTNLQFRVYAYVAAGVPLASRGAVGKPPSFPCERWMPPWLSKDASKKDSGAQLASLIRDVAPDDQPGIVYCLSRTDTETVAHQLSDVGIVCASYHAGFEEPYLASVYEAWLRGDVQVMVCTVSFGMGINLATVRFVIHHSISKHLQAYTQVHVCGRATIAGLLV